MQATLEPKPVVGPPRTAPVRVVVADDHARFRGGVVRGLQAGGGIEVVGEAGDGEAALALICEREPDVALLDVRMPGLGGLEVVAALARRAVPVPVLLLSAFTEPEVVAAALAAGAAGCLGKDAEREDIRRAVLATAAEVAPGAGTRPR
jgi:two-component system nitrate/nitrite response regulator NarL